ncbi:MAG: hypothetical protein JXA67_20805 [Micromonosporaceae bacterium]|nr:hypothetical protein [Micromonosporaceae bacterium]
MSARARAAATLATHLSQAIGTPVVICWDNPTRRPAGGHWRVEWTDGPITATMRGIAAAHARWVTPLEVTKLRWARQYSPTAWAVALLAHAGQATLPDTAGEAVALVEYDLPELDATRWDPATHRAAADLASRHHGDLHQMATAIIAASVTKPGNETPPAARTSTRHCSHCQHPMPTPAATGRPARWCSPACRQAAHRQRGTVTKPRNETPCPACGQPIPTTATGRPARWCSPACRTRAWRTRPRSP